jgi:(p)ppGpp synthase/HD superfamily hydrolase
MALSLDKQLLLAPQVAARAHRTQKRKDGTPYIAHPIRVALRVAPKIGDFLEAMNMEALIVAYLHDVVEDTDVTFDDLRELGFSESVLAALDGVTKRTGEKYMDFIRRCKVSGPVAVAVKLADIEDNLEDQSALDPDEAAFLKNRYERAKVTLNE